MRLHGWEKKVLVFGVCLGVIGCSANNPTSKSQAPHAVNGIQLNAFGEMPAPAMQPGDRQVLDFGLGIMDPATFERVLAALPKRIPANQADKLLVHLDAGKLAKDATYSVQSHGGGGGGWSGHGGGGWSGHGGGGWDGHDGGFHHGFGAYGYNYPFFSSYFYPYYGYYFPYALYGGYYSPYAFGGYNPFYYYNPLTSLYNPYYWGGGFAGVLPAGYPTGTQPAMPPQAPTTAPAATGTAPTTPMAPYRPPV